MKRNFLPAFLLLFAASCFDACAPDDHSPNLNLAIPTSSVSSDLANAYVNLSIKLTKETAGFTPPVAARSYGYLGLTLYEAAVHGMPDYQSLQGVLNGFNQGAVPAPEAGKIYHWGECANRAMSVMMLKLYATASIDNLTAVLNLERTFENQFKYDVDESILERSKAYGEAVANAIFDYAASDGQAKAYSTNFPTSYVSPTYPGAWVPTPPAFQRALQPYWGDVRTFHPDNVTGTQPPKHPEFSTDKSSKFYAEGLEVYNVSKTLTTEQRTIAQFWSDDPGKTGTPPGHSMSIAMQALQRERANLALAAETYAKVGMALHDAFVSCWKCKYVYSLMRPVTYIRQNIDSTYTTLLTTPPFPEYTSGHSVQSGASAKVLSELFGYNYGFTDRTHEARTDINGSPRTYKSFKAAADEAAISRLYGGIHYRAGIDYGVEQGTQIGANIAGLPFKK